MSATFSSDNHGSSVPLTLGPGSQFIMVMPYPGTPGVPFFDGRNVTDFLDCFSDLCTDYKLSDAEKMRRLPRYCDVRIGLDIETIREWRERNWEEFRKVLREEFEFADHAQTYYPGECLEILKFQARTAASSSFELPSTIMSATFSSDNNGSHVPLPLEPRSQSVMVMPYPGTPGAPSFDGRNVTNFLDCFSDLCTDYKLSDAEKMRSLPRYCAIRIRLEIKTIRNWRERNWREQNWEEFRKELRKKYKSDDQAQTYYTRESLEMLKDQARTENEDPRRFCGEYARLSEELTKRYRLDNYTRIRWFLQGLPGFTRMVLCNRLDLDWEDLGKMDFDILLEKALLIAQCYRLLRIVEQGMER